METVYSISLFAGGPAQYGEDGYETNYCGSFSVPCPDDDPIVTRLSAAKVGRGRNEDGSVSRGFFFEDELETMVARAELETGCYTEVGECPVL